MNAQTLNPLNTPRRLAAITLRLAALALATAWFVAGWLAVLSQHETLWQRLPPTASDRFVADLVNAPLPPLPGLSVLRAACAREPGWRASLRSAWLREELAACLTSPDGLVTGQAASDAQRSLRGQLDEQLTAAEGWLQAHDRHADRYRDELRAQLAVQRDRALLPALGRQPAGAVREPVGSAEFIDHGPAELRHRLESARTQRDQILASGTPAGEQARALALLASGLRLGFDYGLAPPRPVLATARGSLADAMEWQRRGHAYVERGFTLQRLRDLPVTLLAGAVLLFGATLLASRGRLGVLLACATLTHLVGLGALVLTDLGLTGDRSLRFLAERQFQGLGVGEHLVALTRDVQLLPGTALHLWWPFAITAVLVLLLGALRDGAGRWLAPARAWVRAGGDVSGGSLQAAVLLALATVCVLFLGLPAAVSELLIFFGCLAGATYLARQAAHANTGAAPDPRSLVFVSVGVGLAVCGSVARGDLGHALVAACLALCFAWMFGWAWLQALILLGVATVAAAIGMTFSASELAGPLTWAAHVLPEHAQQRLEAMPDPFGASSSDLARSRWLMRSAGLWGWGPGYVPWQGLDLARLKDGLPLQGPSDYVLVLAVALWGRAGGTALVALVLLVFLLSGAIGLATALRAGVFPAVRLLAALGGFGCLAVAIKAALSAGGVTGVLPLTGLPVAALGYGPVSLIAALFYLALAWGTTHIRPVPVVHGVVVRPQAFRFGTVRLRGFALATCAVGGVATVLGLGFHRLAQDADQAAELHVARRELEFARSVAKAVVPLESSSGSNAARCEPLRNAVAAWDKHLASLVPARRLDPDRLGQAAEAAPTADCADMARQLGALLASGPARVLSARASDFTTPDPWWGRPGCLQAAGATATAAVDAASCREGSDLLLAELRSDGWLANSLLPRIGTTLRTPARSVVFNGQSMPAGPVVGISLGGSAQQSAQRIADCFTARSQGAPCQGLVSSASGQALRAGAVSIVLINLQTGRLEALAGAISDCSRAQLGRTASTDEHGRVPALRRGEPCAQLPDRRSAWLAGQHPALWMVPPGSSVKPIAVAAAIDAGLIKPDQDARWKSILAESRERLPVQDLALQTRGAFVKKLSEAGWGQAHHELLWGVSPAGDSTGPRTAWTERLFDGASRLRPTSMPLATVEAIRAEKLAGVNVDKRYGPSVVQEYLAARSVADASVGGGDLRISALGLAYLWQSIDLVAQGKHSAPATHLLEQAGQQVPAASHGWISTSAANRILGITSGVTSTAWKGTAQGSCRVVYGACPPQGLPGMSGKTGTADFLVQEQSPFVKPGLQIPSKLFGGVFQAGNGQRYAIAAMALRVRAGGSDTLELTSSAAAEAALALMRSMGVASRNP